MKLAYFPGCKIPFYLKDYGISFKAVMEKLDIELVKLPFNCCGYPARRNDFEISIFSSIKNLAMAGQRGLDIITPCKCCFGQFKHAAFWYNENKDLKQKIDTLLAHDNLSWDGNTKIKHLLSFLHRDFGIQEIEKRIQKKLSGKNIAVQYGCHALRPFSITGFDNPYAPKIFEELLAVTGVNLIEWSKSTECCGNPILNGNRKLSLKILENKIKTAGEEGADYICTACTHCQMQYESGAKGPLTKDKPMAILFTQIMGAALGIRKSRLFNTGKLPLDLF